LRDVRKRRQKPLAQTFNKERKKSPVEKRFVWKLVRFVWKHKRRRTHLGDEQLGGDWLAREPTALGRDALHHQRGVGQDAHSRLSLLLVGTCQEGRARREEMEGKPREGESLEQLGSESAFANAKKKPENLTARERWREVHSVPQPSVSC
jgi:hypothetical protein